MVYCDLPGKVIGKQLELWGSTTFQTKLGDRKPGSWKSQWQVFKVSCPLESDVDTGKRTRYICAICDSDEEPNQAERTVNSFFSTGHVRDLFRSPLAPAGQRLSEASGFHFLKAGRHWGCNCLLEWSWTWGGSLKVVASLGKPFDRTLLSGLESSRWNPTWRKR